MDETENLIDLIYEAPFAPEHWAGILKRMSAIAGARGGMLSSLPVIAGAFFHDGGLDDMLARMQDMGLDVGRSLEEGVLRMPGAAFQSDGDVFPEHVKATMPDYTEFFWPLGIGHTATTHIKSPSGESMMVSFLRSRDAGPASEAILDRLTELRPHIARALSLAVRNSFQQIRDSNQALAATGLAAAAISDTGRVMDSNALFSQLSQHVIIGGGDRLRLAHARANAILEECLEAARHPVTRSATTSRSVALPATEGAGPAVLHLIPARGIVRDLFINTAFFLIISPVNEARPAPLAIIEGLFDLTVSEARIAQALSMGHDVKDMAKNLGITTETVRRHLKNIYSKTGISRQAELSATIAGLKVI